MRRSLVAGVTILAATALAVSLAASAVGAPQTTLPILPIAIKVSLTNQQATLDRKAIERGAIVQFRIRNTTGGKRVFSIGGQKTAVKPKGFGILLIAFDVRGAYKFESTGPVSVQRGVLRVI